MTVDASQAGGNSQDPNNVGTGNQPPEGQQQQQTQQDNTTAPYAPYLEKLPETVRPLVEPTFKEWDQGVNQRFQQLHSQYDWAKPYQELAQQGYDAETISQGLSLLDALSNNPQGLYEAIGNAYNITPGQAQQIVEQGLQEPEQQQQQQIDPRFQQLESTVNTLADIMIQERQQQQETQEEQQFYSMLDGLKQKHGEFDQDYVIAKIASGTDPEQAVVAYRQLVMGQAQQLNDPGRQAPVVMGGGGGQPTTSVDVKSLDAKGRQQLVASLLEAQNRG